MNFPFGTERATRFQTSEIVSIMPFMISDFVNHFYIFHINEISEFEFSSFSESDGPSAPVFIMKPKSIAVEESTTAKLSAEIWGMPEPTVRWLKDGKTISGDRFKVNCEVVVY